MSKTEENPSLNMLAAIYAEICTILSVQFRSFGHKRQMVELKLSLAFCVWLPKHVYSKSSFDKSL